VPSSFCGIFGLKPTYGRLSRARSFPFVASFDHLGPFARNVGDLALAYDAMQGPDADDAACTTRPVEPVTALLAQGIAAAGRDCRRLFPEERLSGSGRGRVARSRKRSMPRKRSKFPRPRAPAPRLT
jgi:aspartyl-tRNA(Asn)/glutamyl-tRNA(Gln) amidotransferase subunit A